MKYWTMLVIAYVAAGCIGEERCRVEELDEGSRVECPGEDAFETDTTVEGACWNTGEAIECDSGESFELPSQGDGGGGAGDGLGGSGVGSNIPGGDPYRADCQRVGQTVICNDGRTATLPDDTDDEATCRSEMVAGVGRRINCGGEEYMPDQDDDTDVSCEYRAEEEGVRAVLCSDGTAVVGDEVPDERCTPTIERQGDEVVVVECGEMRLEILLGPCDRDWTIRTKADADEFREAGCETVYGDVLVGGETCTLTRPSEDEVLLECEGEDPIEVSGDVQGPCWRAEATVECKSGESFELEHATDAGNIETLEALEEVDHIGGSLIIENNPFLVEAHLDDLESVGESLILRRNPKWVSLTTFAELYFVLGSFVISDNGVVHWAPPAFLTDVDEGFTLSSNTDLERIGYHDEDGDNFVWMMPPFLEVGGSAVVTDNDALGWCVTQQLGRYLGIYGRAERVYVGGEPAEPEERECEFIEWGYEL